MGSVEWTCRLEHGNHGMSLDCAALTHLWIGRASTVVGFFWVQCSACAKDLKPENFILQKKDTAPASEWQSGITLVIQALHAWLRFMHFIIEILYTYVYIYILYIVYIYICLNVCNLFGTLNFEANFEGGPYIYIYVYIYSFFVCMCTRGVCVCVCLCVCVSDLMCSDKVLRRY